jgi:hypothetical protein
MGTHRPTLVRLDNVTVGPDLQMRCACNWYSPRYTTRQECEDDHQRHLAAVERLRASMRRTDPSLTDQYAYYMEQAENPVTSEADRKLWLQLASELEGRLPSRKGTEQLSLDL